MVGAHRRAVDDAQQHVPCRIMGEIVKTILAIVLVASQTTYYEAKVTTFGCTSIDAVSQLQKVRSDGRAFQAALMES